MADAQSNLARFQEVARRGLQDNLAPDKRARFDEGVRRGIIVLPENIKSQNLASQIRQNQPQAIGGITARVRREASKQKPKTSFGENVVGIGDAALTFARGLVGTTVGGVLGSIKAAKDFITGEDDPLKAGAERSQAVQGAITGEPFTEAGKDALSMVSVPFEKLHELAVAGGEKTLDVTGSPALATLAQTTLETAPMAFGVRRPGSKTIAERNIDIANVMDETKAVGLDVAAPIARQREQLVESGRNLGAQEVKAQDIGIVQDALQKARVHTEALVENIYFDAKRKDASVNTFQVTELQKSINSFFDDKVFMVSQEITPKTVVSLEKLDEIASGGFETAVEIKRLMKYRRANNKMRGADATDNAGLAIINGQMDAYLRTQVTKDLVSGDATAVAKWQEAFKGTKDFKEIFDADKAIKNLSTKLDATPEMAKNWIMGKNSVGAKAEAGAIVKKIGEIVGKDGPEFGALRQEILFDIVEPLLKAQPNYKGFANNYDKFVRHNGTLARELFPESLGEMTTLRRFASALEKGSARGLDLNLNQTVARILFGHEIAKGAVRVNLGTNLLNAVRSTAGSSPKQLMISDFTGYDITKPLLPKAPVAIGATIQTAQQENN